MEQIENDGEFPTHFYDFNSGGFIYLLRITLNLNK
jgi:hypothetical protein